MRQGDLFDLAPRSTSSPSAGELPDPHVIRARLHALIAELRAAREMPWEAPRARAQEHIFYNMANWLPAEERDTLRAAFLTELDRLRR